MDLDHLTPVDECALPIIFSFSGPEAQNEKVSRRGLAFGLVRSVLRLGDLRNSVGEFHLEIDLHILQVITTAVTKTSPLEESTLLQNPRSAKY